MGICPYETLENGDDVRKGNLTSASINKATSRKWEKFQPWVNLPINSLRLKIKQRRWLSTLTARNSNSSVTGGQAGSRLVGRTEAEFQRKRNGLSQQRGKTESDCAREQK